MRMVLPLLSLLALGCGFGALLASEDSNTNCNDFDGDGSERCTSGGGSYSGDCDDDDPSRYPENSERCDGVDNDCDTWVDEGALMRAWDDLDNDGYGAGPASEVCALDRIQVRNGDDCNDENRAIHPGATERCDEKDNDCDGGVDEGVDIEVFFDADEDGYGDSTLLRVCEMGADNAQFSGDCESSDDRIHPGAAEDCSNGVDDDCDGLMDCEDGECAEVCTELACGDGLDDDNDGLVDCADADCFARCAGTAELMVTGGQYERIGSLRGETLASQSVQVWSVSGQFRWSTGSCDWFMTSATREADGGIRRGAVLAEACPELIEPTMPSYLYSGRFGLGTLSSTSSWYVTKALPSCDLGDWTCIDAGTLGQGGWFQAAE